MNLGMGEKRILVLAGGADQIDLLKDLKDRGYYTILVDYYANPIAKPFADKHIQESTLDKEKVLKIAIDEQVDNVITACTDQALVTVAYVAEKLGFNKQFSYVQTLNFTNKSFMKEILMKHSIPTARFVNVSDVHDVGNELIYPLIVKPADSGSSKGVRKVESENCLFKAFEEARQNSRTGDVIVEEYKTGVEISVDAFIVDGKARRLMCSEIRKSEIDGHQIIYQSCIPAIMSEKATANLDVILNQIAKAFGLNNTPLLVQTIVDGNDVWVIEFSARIGGGQKHVNVKEKTGFDILHQNVNCVLGEPVSFEIHEDKTIISRTHLYMYPGVFDHVANIEKLLSEGMMSQFVCAKSSGTKIDNVSSSACRIGSFMVKAQTREEMERKINYILTTLRVENSNGEDLLFRPIYQ